MLVHNVQASIRFYQTLGFYVAATEMDVDGRPLWALLRRDDADLLLMARSTWPASVPLPTRPVPMTLVLGGAAPEACTDPDGVRVEPSATPHRRAA